MQDRTGRGNTATDLTGPMVERNVILDRIAPCWVGLRSKACSTPSMSLPLLGRIPPPVRLRALLLQARPGPSNPAVEAAPEAALADRLSFRRIPGLRLDEPTPDH